MKVADLWSWAAFPGTVIASLAAVWGLQQAGLGPANAVLLVTGLVALGLGLAQFLGRHELPRGGVVGTDILHLLLSNGLVHGFLKLTLFGAVLWLTLRLQGTVGDLWPHDLPLPLQVLLAMVLGELAFYTVHRAMHEVPRLWPLHAVHHSSTVLYVLAGARNHPLNVLLSYAAQFFPAMILGAGDEVIVYLSAWTTTVGMLQHSDLGLRTGWLSWVLATPDIHRIHHSTELPEGNSNYGSNLLLWDHIFGTFTPPDHRPAAVGIAGVDVPPGYVGHLRAPFR
ncbi:MAG: sterol desaturase family protein, partial [Deltaproteobacteria bacterium]